MDTDEDRIGYCRAEREKAIEIVRSIDEDDWRFYSAEANEEMQEITAEYRADQVRTIEIMDRLIAWLERDLPKASPTSRESRLGFVDHDAPP